MLSSYELTLTILLALLLDAIFGEVKKYHYLVGFGWLSQFLELRLNAEHHKTELAKSPKSKNLTAETNLVKETSPAKEADLTDSSKPKKRSSLQVFKGTIAWALLVLPLPVIYFYYLNDFIWYWQVLLDGCMLYLAIGLNSLNKHALQVYYPLQEGNLLNARHFTGYLVSRDTQTLSADEMSRATVESMLENGHDAVIASLIYYLIGGIPLVILHRFANTLDAMWGYKTPRFYGFGYTSARLDDVLGFFTAKCCTVLYAIQGMFQGLFLLSLKNAYQQGNCYKSHNGGWVMAAGATVMKRALGGMANYHGTATHSVLLGKGKAVSFEDIPDSVNVVRLAVIILLLLLLDIQTLQYLLNV